MTAARLRLISDDHLPTTYADDEELANKASDPVKLLGGAVAIFVLPLDEPGPWTSTVCHPHQWPGSR